MKQLDLFAKPEKTRYSASCARCGRKADRWSGAWVLEDGWIGWCSSECRRCWLKGAKGD